MTERTVTRQARKVERLGISGIKHGNIGRRPVNRVDSELRARAVALLRRDYYDLNMTHALERLASDHGIVVRRETFRRWCHEAGLVKRRKTRRSPARVYRERMPHEGMLLQLDGSPHRWNGKDTWTLISAIDDATSDIPYAEFFVSEDTESCMRVLWRIIERVGVPEALYVDRAGIYGGTKRQGFTHFARACDELGIRILFAHSPEAKGRIERSFQTLQDRLVPEMRLRKIFRMETANRFLVDEYLPGIWRQRFRKPARSPEKRYMPLSKHIDLNEVFCLKNWRTIGRDRTVSVDNRRWLLDLPTPHSLKGQKVEVRDYLDGSRKYFFAGREVRLIDLASDNRAICRKAG
jgi:transposase-like protein